MYNGEHERYIKNDYDDEEDDKEDDGGESDYWKFINLNFFQILLIIIIFL